MRRTYKNMKTPIKTKTVKIVTNKKSNQLRTALDNHN